MLDSDLDVLFSGPDAVSVTIGASSFKGLYDCPDSEIAEGMMINSGHMLTAKTSDLASADEGTGVRVDGIDFEIMKIIKMDDGKISKVYLTKV